MHIVLLDGDKTNPGDLSWAPLEALGTLTVYPNTPAEEAAARIGNADAVIDNKVPLTRAVLKACPRLRYVGLLSTGYDVVDLDAAQELGITVANAPGYSTRAVAQHTLALLLELTNCAGHHSQAVHAGRWNNETSWSFWDEDLAELGGKTLGIIGLGSIGLHVAQIAGALGMRVLAHSPTRRAAGEAVAQYVPLAQLLAESDVVSLHCPLTAATQGIISADALAAMRPGALLINTARGALLDETAVAAALHSGRLAGAALDVVAVEPIRADNPLLAAPNCILTPHIAWAAKETRARLIDLVADNLRAFLAGQPQNTVGV